MNGRVILINESQQRRLLDSVREQWGSWTTYSPRLQAIEKQLRSRVQEPAHTRDGVVTLGSRVRVREVGQTDGRDWLIVYPECADPEMGALSVFSPLGWELLGRRAGEQIWFDEGKGMVRCEIEYVLSPVPGKSAASVSDDGDPCSSQALDDADLISS